MIESGLFVTKKALFILFFLLLQYYWHLEHYITQFISEKLMHHLKNSYTKSIVWLFFILLGSSSLLKSQTITIDNTNFFTGIYGRGSDVAVPITVNGCFGDANTFQIYLSDATGSFAAETLIGTYNGFFTTFVNGIIPGIAPPGAGYKIRVKATQPAITSVNETGAFTIQAYGPPALRARLDASFPNTILSDDLAYGYCSGSTVRDLLMANGSTAGSTNIVAIKNETTGVTVNGLTFNASNEINFTLQRTYYTAIIRSTKDGVNATKAYHLINSPNRLQLGTDGEPQGCLPDTLVFQIAVDPASGGIGGNYPGTRYFISWGDTSQPNLIKHCELIANNGVINHLYNNTSCDSAGISFNVTATLINPWRNNMGTTTQQNCDQPQVTTRAKIFKKPVAEFETVADTFCVNTLRIFDNISDPGQGQLSGQCTIAADYYWYVDNVLVQTNLNANPPPDLEYTFTTIGTHVVRLRVLNNSCGFTEFRDTVCVEPVPVPDFKINGKDTIAGCAPLTFTPTNLTNNNPCRQMNFEWLVYNNITGAIIPAGTGIFTVTPSINAPNPTFTFLVPGFYRMRLTAANSCGVFQSNWRYIEVIEDANVTMPGNVSYCDIRTIDFATHPAHRPVFNTNIGDETFLWTVTGGNFGFIGGTSATSQYPNIEFLDFATYTVRLIFTNNCGIDTVFQNITFNQPVTANVGPVKDSTICYNINSLQLNASFTGLASSTVWTTTGTGSFSNNTALNPIYTLSTPDKNNGLIRLIFSVTPQGPTVCPVRRDTLIVRVSPNNTGVTSAINICSDTRVNYTPVSTVSGSTFTWTSTLLAGSLNGASATGSGIITDSLSNPSTTVDAIIRYTITPSKNGCIGEPFELNVTVKAKPDLISVLPIDTICNNTTVGITYSTTATGVSYTWNAALISGTATGFSSQVTPVTTTAINQILNNTGTTPARIRYIITVAGATGCVGERDTLFVVVRPNPSAANAGPDQRLCNAPSVLLNGNIPTVGIGTWTQIAGPAVTILTPTLNNTGVSGLTADNVYSFVWEIRGGGTCPTRRDTVVIFNRPTVTPANAGTDIVYCDLQVSGSVNLAGNANPARTYETGQWTIFAQPTGGNGTFGNSTVGNTSFSFSRSGNYTLIWTISSDATGCAPSRDTVVVKVYDRPVAGTINASNPNVCKNDNITFTLTGFTGVIQKWQYNPNPIGDNIWIDTAVTNSTIDFINIQDTFAVRAIVVSAGLADGCTTTATTSALTINVAPPTISGTTGPPATVCKNLNSGAITLTGFVGNIVRWEFSINNGTTWTPIASTASSIAYNNISTTTWYRAIVQSGACLGSPSTTTIITVIDPVTPANAGPNQKLCFTNTATLTGNTPATIENGTWTQVTGPNTATLSAINTPTVTASALIPGTYTFEWKLENGTCPPTRDTVEVIIRPTITIANAGSDKVICDFALTGSTNLNGNLGVARPFETGLWTIISQPAGGAGSFINANSPTTAFSFARSGVYQLVWTISNDAGCTPTTDTVLIKVYDLPVAGTISVSNPNVCAGNNVTFTLNGSVGVIQKWQYNPKPISDNIWLDTAVTTPTISFINVQDTFAVRVIVVSAGLADGCTTTATATAVTVNVAPATIAGNTNPDATVCRGTNNGNITLTGFVGNIVRWELSTNSGTSWTPIATTASTIGYTNLLVTTWYRAIVQSGACSGTPSDTTIITVVQPVTTANAGTDRQLCNQTTATLTANAVALGETGTWSQFSGPSVANFSSTTVPNPTVTNLVVGTYRFIWSIANGTCPPSRDTVDVINYPSIINIIDTVTYTYCTGQTVTLTGTTPTGGNGSYTYQWQRSVDGVTWVNLTGATLPTYNFTASTTLYYRRLVTSTPCQTASDKVLVLVQPPLGNNSISSNQTICTNTSAALLNGTIPTGADGLYVYNWQQSIDGGTTWTNIPGANTQSYNPGILTQTTRFRRIVTSQFCSGNQGVTSNVVIITVNPDARAQFTATNYIGCPPFTLTSLNIVTTPYPDRNNIYSWYANNVLIGTGVNFPGYTINNDGDSVTIKLVVTSSFVCRNDSMQAKFYTFDLPEPAFTASDTVICGPAVINFTNNTPNINGFNYLWNFGNGQTSTAINPPGVNFATSALYGDTVYTVSLRAFTICDTFTVSKQIRIKSKPKALFTPNRSTGCSPFNVTFTNNSLGSNVTYDWSFDDGTTLTTTATGQLQHTFITGVPDTFFVKLRATNECGVDSQRFAIVVAPNTININFAVNGNEVTGCAPHTVNFINNSSGASSFRWDFGDGNTLNTFANIDTVTHTYNLAGTFNVVLQATNGCSDTSDTEIIQVFEKPTVNFNANPISACIGDSVRFNNLSTPTGIGYLWRFGDGSTSTLTNPAKLYAAAGIYPVTLIASRQYNPGNACVDSITKQVSIVATQPGVFDITDTLGGCQPFTTTFINRSRPSILTTWNFGDGNTATGDSVTHTFTTLGNFTVTMTARSAGGCTYQKSRQVLVQGPTGTLSYDNGFICNRPVRLQAVTANTDSIRWNFGNGVTLTTTNNVVFYTYPLPGRYLPSAELIGRGGCRITLAGTDTIKIDNIDAGFSSAQQRFCGYTTVAFADTSRSFFGINQYSWQFGDGNTSNQPNPQNNFSATNTWPVRLIIRGNSGCTDTAYVPTFVKVNDKPTAGIVSDTVACINQPLTFTALVNSVDTVNFYTWNFGNSATASTPVATYNFTLPATYLVQLITGTTNGCYDTTEQRVTVHPRPNVTASTDVLICRGQSTQLNTFGAATYAWTPFQGLSNPAIANPVANPLTTTQYVVTGFNNFGCSNRDTVVVSVAQPFNIQVSGNDSICIGQQTRLSVSGASNYTWFPATGLDNATSPNPIANPTVTTIYRVIGTDNFSCFADTAYVTVAVGGYPVVSLGQDRTLAAGTLLTLNPSITNGPIRNYIWSPVADLSCANCPTPIATIKKDVCYSLTAINAYGCAGSDTMCVKAFCESTQVFIPNTFTPDNDGINDLLVVRGKGIKLVKSFRIFNRWGQVVFERGNFPPNDAAYAWNGKIKGGAAAPPDVYVYTCEVVCEDDTPFVYKGNVAIIK